MEFNKEDLFVSLKQAKKLKNLGFDEPCVARFIGSQFSMNVAGNWYRHNSNEVATNFLAAPFKFQAFNFLHYAYNIYNDRFPRIPLDLLESSNELDQLINRIIEHKLMPIEGTYNEKNFKHA